MLQQTHFYKSLCADKQVFLQHEKQEEMPGHKRRVRFEFWSMSVNCSLEKQNFVELLLAVRVLTQILTNTSYYKTLQIVSTAWWKMTPQHGFKFYISLITRLKWLSSLASSLFGLYFIWMLYSIVDIWPSRFCKHVRGQCVLVGFWCHDWSVNFTELFFKDNTTMFL